MSTISWQLERSLFLLKGLHTSLQGPCIRKIASLTHIILKLRTKFFYQPDDGDIEVSILFAHIPAVRVNFWALSATSALAVLFGAIHCLAWTFAFPTKAERVLWRVCSLVIAIAPIVVGVRSISRCWDVVTPTDGRWKASRRIAPDILFFVIMVLSPIYVLARIYLLFGALLALRNVPRDALSQINWVNYIPHI